MQNKTLDHEAQNGRTEQRYFKLPQEVSETVLFMPSNFLILTNQRVLELKFKDTLLFTAYEYVKRKQNIETMTLFN